MKSIRNRKTWSIWLLRFPISRIDEESWKRVPFSSFLFSFLSAAEDAKRKKENAFLLVETDKETERDNVFFLIFCFRFLPQHETKWSRKMNIRKRVTENLFGLPFSHFRIPVNGSENGNRFPVNVIVLGFCPSSHMITAKSTTVFLQSFGFQYNIPVWDIRFQEHWHPENEQWNSQSLSVFRFAFFVLGKITKTKLMKSGNRQTFTDCRVRLRFQVLTFAKRMKTKTKSGNGCPSVG